MLFDVPFLPVDDYADFLAENADRLYCVHFSLHSHLAADARQPGDRVPPELLIDTLSRVRGPRKYALINSRFHDPRDYFDTDRLTALASLLDTLREADILNGIVYDDHYLLQALSDTAPQTCAELEAVPSVNAMLTSSADVLRRLEFIAATAFRPPSKVVLDRAFNRDMDRLAETSETLRNHRPELGLALLANEGCLASCPFKSAHDSLTALASQPCTAHGTFPATSRLGCGRLFSTDSRQIFQSPFIRPEDAHTYTPYVDALKLCGRTRGPRAMRTVVEAYLNAEYNGNLLDLLDSMEFLAPTIRVDNKTLPEDFHTTVARCGGNCDGCAYCSGLAARCVERIRPAAALKSL